MRNLSRHIAVCLFWLCVGAASVQAATFEKLAPEKRSLLDRQNWALAMLGRLDQANRVILDPEYVVRQRERFEKLAQPLILDTSQKEVRETIQTLRDEVEKSERIAIEHLDRQFRRTLTQKLKSESERTLQQRWFEGWQKTVQAWQKLDDRTDRLHQLIDWLKQSNRALEGKDYAAVTPVPSFTGNFVKKPTPVTTASKDPETATDSVVPPLYITKKPTASPEVATKDKPAIEVNLPEMAAQVSGNNLALRRLEAKLVDGGIWDAKRIDPFVVQLKQIATRQKDARMIYRLLSPTQQKQIDTIADVTSAIKSLRSKISTARVTTLESRGPSASLTNEQRVDLKNLDRLSEELNSIGR